MFAAEVLGAYGGTGAEALDPPASTSGGADPPSCPGSKMAVPGRLQAVPGHLRGNQTAHEVQKHAYACFGRGRFFNDLCQTFHLAGDDGYFVTGPISRPQATFAVYRVDPPGEIGDDVIWNRWHHAIESYPAQDSGEPAHRRPILRQHVVAQEYVARKQRHIGLAYSWPWNSNAREEELETVA